MLPPPSCHINSVLLRLSHFHFHHFHLQNVTIVVDPSDSAWASERGTLSNLDSFQVDDMACTEWRITLPRVIVDGVDDANSFTTVLSVSVSVHEAMVARLLALCYAWDRDRQRYEDAMQATASPIGSSTEVPQFAPTQVAGARDVRCIPVPSTFAIDLRNLPWVPIEPQRADDRDVSRTGSGPRSHSRDDDAVSQTGTGASRKASGESVRSRAVSVAKYTVVPTKFLKRHFGPLVNFLSEQVFDAVQRSPLWLRIEKQLGLRRWTEADRPAVALMTINVLNEWSLKTPDEVPMLSVGEMERMCVVGVVLYMSCTCVRVVCEYT